MSYKALLFCPDEAAARLVTQVLSELDFTVELSFEPFVTVKKLSEETFDALVVDCTNEQNAAVLFKGARSSTLNHSLLCVAVAEGQAGLANAFRIGANLVLTKPINIEQSKNTLRVARGLLRKNSPQSQSGRTVPQSKPPAAPTAGSTPAFSAAPAPTPSAPAVPSVPAMAAPVATPSMPSSLLEAEQKRSQPSSGAAPTSTPNFASGTRTTSAPSFGSTQSSAGFGAAPALAPERADHAHTVTAEPRPLPEIRTAPPLATHDTIFPETTFPEKTAPAVPTFSSYAHHSARKSGGGSKAMWIIPCLLVLGAAGYFGWRKYQPMRFVHLRVAGTSAGPAAPTVESANRENKPSPSADVSFEQQNTSAPAVGSSNYPPTAPSSSTTSATPTAPAGAEGFATKEHIEISTPAQATERPVTIVAKPVQVSRKAAPAPVAQEQPTLAPPALVITGTNPNDSTIAGLVTANATLPKAAPTKLRISQGLTQGLVVKRVPPVYPLSALQLRREGTVELLATVSKSGSITNVKVVSGDPTLAKAATEAVKQWKYRPYLLNGDPVEIETQISMIFKLPR
jgi:TonB family protein